MPGPKPPEIKLTPLLMQILEKISRRYTNLYWLVVRAKMVLFAQAGDKNSEIARRLDTEADTVAHWRARWLTATPRLSAAESEHMPERDLCSLIVATLADDFRPGMPNTIIPEQIIQMVAVACEDPKDSAREISHWTPRELAAEVQKRDIVETLSPRHLGRILAKMDLQPHRSCYWLTNERDQDPAPFDSDVQAICELYAAAPALAFHGTHLESLDEKAGALREALERKHAMRPMKPGQVELREFEYERHGTLVLIANFDVATGQILRPSLGPTRTEEDLVTHVRQKIATAPADRWIFVLDQLNTHQSAGLVNLSQSCASST